MELIISLRTCKLIHLLQPKDLPYLASVLNQSVPLKKCLRAKLRFQIAESSCEVLRPWIVLCDKSQCRLESPRCDSCNNHIAGEALTVKRGEKGGDRWYRNIPSSTYSYTSKYRYSFIFLIYPLAVFQKRRRTQYFTY